MDIPIATANATGIAGSCTALTCAALNWLGQYHDGMSVLIGACGCIVALGGLAATIYFQIKRDRRETAEYKHRIFLRRSSDIK